ncbi:MAG TPA: hypothetical protein PKE58_16785, partial [Acidobacteriota bacterium]|nr:hypothetical protein [Acidobacteriota bacterium]
MIAFLTFELGAVAVNDCAVPA